ncbi:MAG: hypothetical protein ACYC21_14940 [Eubacteriales bacterium]
MRIAGFYFICSITIGILQIIDGILLVLNKGSFNTFNLTVASIEFLWVPVCIAMIFLCKRIKVSLLSPVSYIIYNALGWGIGVFLAPQNQDASITVIPIWAAVIGAGFGVYYVIINDRFFRKLL